MPLSLYEPPTERIPLPMLALTDAMREALEKGDATEADIAKQRENFFTVRALILDDISYLINHHLGDLVKVFEIYSGQKRGNASTAVTQMATIVARDLPSLAAEIISVASDEIDPKAKLAARKLSAVTQINALLTITKLSSEEAGGLKNLLALVGPAVANVVNPGTTVPGALKSKLLAFITGLGGMPISLETTATKT